MILTINQIEPMMPLTPASAGVEEEKLVKNSGVKWPAPLMMVCANNATNTTRPINVQRKNNHLLTLFLVSRVEIFLSTLFCRLTFYY